MYKLQVEEDISLISMLNVAGTENGCGQIHTFMNVQAS